MRHSIGTVQRLDTSLRIDPRVVLASQLLQLAQNELDNAIEAELAENPALERLEDNTTPVQDDEIYRSIAPERLSPHSDDREFSRSLPNDDDSTDWVDFAQSTPCLRDHLVAQLLPVLPKNLQNLGMYLCESINYKGYLEEPPEEVALATGCSIEDAEHAISMLQKCDPPGIGARDIRECLLLQLRGGDSVDLRVARAILKGTFEDFLAGRTMKLARRFGVMPDVIEQAFSEIRQLTPFPGEAYVHSNSERRTRSVCVQPDLALHRDEAGWTVEVFGPDPSTLRVSQAYLDRAKELKSQRSVAQDEKRHVGHFVQRASDFISCLEQRGLTLRRIGQYLIQEQPGFVSTGRFEFLQPLTRSQLAADLGIHESTVSRATADKFIQLASGEIVAFEVFFKPALRVQKMIEEILSTENPNDPMSDERIAELLAKKGVHVARRTVNKYRDRTKLLSSRKRKTA